ncbi:unnamed protein product [Symbiodinium sp. CCMP2592]|nr:unnamed protein product [Symbiodinium sp. CCMP2592]CAE7742169.1 unnamed protein product [Symbiodinium sp. CCMP2592]
MESKLKANPGLSMKEYVDQTIHDALEMFGSGEDTLELLDALDSCQSYGSGAALPQAFQLDVPMEYIDARGEHRTTIKHEMLAINAHAAQALRSYWEEELAATSAFVKPHPAFDAAGPNWVGSLLILVWSVCMQDPDCNLDYVVPLRLYGDGADAYRSGVHPRCDAFGKEFGFYNKKMTCHFCSAIQWINAVAKPGEPNNVELLYSCFGHDALHRSTMILTKEDFIEAHGLLPDYMHMVHLAVAVDFLGSMLLEVTDDTTIMSGPSREKRLDLLWKDYRSWAEASQIGDRASRRMFTTAVLRNNKNIEVSQKILSATACRYMLLWACTFLTTVCEQIAPTSILEHLLAAATAFRDMEMLMIHNGHSVSTMLRI